MVAMARDELTPFAAWPTAVVTNPERKQVLGIVLPRANGMEIHSLYTPANRKRLFPEADWRFLVRVATAFAAGVQALHRNGIVIGDINQGNCLVASNAVVKFIDCDSFQIQTAKRTYRCEVGVPHFTPPELQGVSFSEVDRTVDHDGFGLAVMIFHLLFAGRHPFVGRYLGPGDLPIEKAISYGRFAYGKHRSLLQMEPPPHALRIEELTPRVAELLETAFASGGSGVSQRPRPSDWCAALKELEASLVECDQDHGHWFVGGSPCPWCRIEHGGGPNLFASVSQDWHHSRRNDGRHSRILRSIDALPVDLQKFLNKPSNPLVFDDAIPTPGAAKAFGIQRHLGYAAVIAAFASLLGFYWWGFWMIFIPTTVVLASKYFLFGYLSQASFDIRHLKKLIQQSGKQMLDLHRKAQPEIEAIEKRAAILKSIARKARIELELLDGLWCATLGPGDQGASNATLDEQLEDELICEYQIFGIESAERTLLESFGVEAASDVTCEKLRSIPGLKKEHVFQLLAWKSSKVSMLLKDGAERKAKEFTNHIDIEYLAKKIPIQAELLALRGSLDSCLAIAKARIDEINAEHQQLLGNLEGAKKELQRIQDENTK
jgi:DNA-binding helix-hairpin-helix protein with protein kinase domain